MSTRASIVVTCAASIHSEASTVRLHKNVDGYPTDVLRVISAAVERGLAQIVARRIKFAPAENAPRPLGVDQLVGLLIGEATTVYGMDLNIDIETVMSGGVSTNELAKYRAHFDSVRHLGQTGGIHWTYVIDLTAKTVVVMDGAGAALADPLSYVRQLRADCQASERAEIEASIVSIEAMGFKINPKVKARAKRSKVVANGQI